MLRVPVEGDVVAGKYEIGRPLGKGGMGVVVEARNNKLASRVAIKFLMPDAVGEREAMGRFEREARAAALIDSPFVVRVLDVDATEEGLPFIVMEYVEGRDLMSELRERERVSVAEAVDWILQACAGLAHAHARGILHRDIKPSNLFLCREPTGSVVKLMDFGVSKIVVSSVGETEITTTETTVGTPTYMAPEQLVSSKSVDHRADLWSLGVVLYRALSGALPFRGPTPTATAIAIATTRAPSLLTVAKDVPPDLAHAVMRLLEPDPARRFPDSIAFGRAIERFGTGRVAFESAIAGLPRPAMSSAQALEEHAVGLSDRAGAASAAEAPPPPPSGMKASFALALGAPVAFIIASLVVWAVLRAAPPAGARPELSPPPSTPSASGSPVEAFGPLTPPPSIPAATEVAPPSPSSASPSARATPSVRPSSPPSKPRPAPSASPPPGPADPLHL
ncbi:MAG: serine/threonine protein kinase [Deltaproteobacteria bacterium]|nr:serine/threonine protein kinase [Deltaproteobacteria bacterium]